MPDRLNLVVGRDEPALGTIHNILAADGSVDLDRATNIGIRDGEHGIGVGSQVDLPDIGRRN